MRSPFTDFAGQELYNGTTDIQNENSFLATEEVNDPYGSADKQEQWISWPRITTTVNKSPSCDLAIAVTAFSASQVQKLSAPLLSPAVSKNARKWNLTNLPVLKVDPLHVLTDLSRYVDLAVIKQEINRYNTTNAANPIEMGTAPVDAVFVEALHQFQCKIYIPTKGVLGESWKNASISNTTGNRHGKADYGTLQSLGIRPVSFYFKINSDAVKLLGEEKISVSINGTICDSSNWIYFMLNPPVFGLSCNRPIHYTLLKQLRIAEAYLLGLPRFKGDNIIDMALKMGFNTKTMRHPGGREKGKGMHTYGLALDLGYVDNPFIGAGFLEKIPDDWRNMSKAKRQAKYPEATHRSWYERYNMLRDIQIASGEAATGSVISQFLFAIGKAKGANTYDVYDDLKQRSNKFVDYLKLNKTAESYWRKSATFGDRNPLSGFLNLDRDLVYALRQVAGLAWGAVDIGAGERGNGDIMHFDMRTMQPGMTVSKNRRGGDPKDTHPMFIGTSAAKEIDEVNYDEYTGKELQEYESEYKEEEGPWDDQHEYNSSQLNGLNETTVDEESFPETEYDEPETESLYEDLTDEIETEEEQDEPRRVVYEEYEEGQFESGADTAIFNENDDNEFSDEDVHQHEYDANNEWAEFTDNETTLNPFMENQVAGIPQVLASTLYGGFDLRIGDSDSKNRYGGVVSAVTGNRHVAQLQDDLRVLGFGYVGARSDGGFGINTRIAVREFQLHAKMDFLAEQTQNVSRVYADSLIQVRNTSKYAGFVSGVVNAATRSLIQLWLQNNWRCPVIIEAWDMQSGARHSNAHSDLWRYNDLANTKPRMFAIDFSGYYRAGTARVLTDRQVLGDYSKYGSWSGPGSVPPNHTWPEAEFLPNVKLFSSINNTLPVFPQLNPAQRSTFRVLRAVSEVECNGFYDGLNAYDNVFMSIPLLHGVLGERNDASGGELGGFISFFADQFTLEFDRLFGFCGIKANTAWNGNGTSLFRQSRRFTSTLSLQNDNGSFSNLVTDKIDEYHWFRSWHWFYRFAMAGRTSPLYQQALWRYARARLRGLLSTPWDNNLEVRFMQNGVPQTRKATIGDIFTSEKAVAILLRWHVRMPGEIAYNNIATARTRNIAARSGLNLQSPLNITIADESALVQSLVNEASARTFASTINNVRDWPRWVSRTINPAGGHTNIANYTLDPAFCNPLSVIRNPNGFPLDTSNLPPAP